jgi:hypothetical protein
VAQGVVPGLKPQFHKIKEDSRRCSKLGWIMSLRRTEVVTKEI